MLGSGAEIEKMTEAEMLDFLNTWDTIQVLEAAESEAEEDFDEFEDDTEALGHCVVCWGLFHIKKLNSRGECPDHVGETLLSDEAQEDWESYIENLNKY